MAAQRELARTRHMKNKPKDKLPDERFFSIFSSKTAMDNAPFLLKTPSLYCCIKYDSQWVPEIFFVDPVQIRGMIDKNGGSKQWLKSSHAMTKLSMKFSGPFKHLARWPLNLWWKGVLKLRHQMNANSRKSTSISPAPRCRNAGFWPIQNPVRSSVSMANCKRKETSKEGIEGWNSCCASSLWHRFYSAIVLRETVNGGRNEPWLRSNRAFKTGT